MEKQERLRQLLRGKQGRELVGALIDEIVMLSGRVDALTEELAGLRAYHELSAPLLQADMQWRNEVRPRGLVLDASQLFEPGRGFYSLEYDRNGTPFRWTGPQPDFSFMVYVDRRQPLDLELMAIGLVDRNVQTVLTVTVDGVVLPLRLAERAGMWAGNVEVPASDGYGATAIDVRVPELFVPKGSTRAIGIAFHRLSLRPVQGRQVAASPAGGAGSEVAQLEFGQSRP